MSNMIISSAPTISNQSKDVIRHEQKETEPPMSFNFITFVTDAANTRKNAMEVATILSKVHIFEGFRLQLLLKRLQNFFS